MRMTQKLIGIFSIFALCSTTALAAQVELIAHSERVLARPHDLVLDPEGVRLYVTDMDNSRIVVMDPDKLTIIEIFGENELDRPHDIVFDDQGRILVADTGNSRIAVYDLSGGQIRMAAEYTDRLSWTEGVALGPDGSVYATNVGDNSAVKLLAGRAVERVAGSGSAPGEFVRPHDIDVWRDKVYIADPGNNRIQVFDLGLRPIRELRADFKEPKYMGLDEHGWLYVADQHHNLIKVFNDSEELVIQFGADQLNYPEGVEVLGDRIWISDTYNDRVVLYKWHKGP